MSELTCLRCGAPLWQNRKVMFSRLHDFCDLCLEDELLVEAIHAEEEGHDPREGEKVDSGASERKRGRVSD